MARFRKRPVEIDAEQFTGDNADEIARFAGFNAQLAGRERRLEIRTLEGVMTASPGDWIIRGVQGEYYPCKPDIFAATYEPVPDVNRFTMNGEVDDHGTPVAHI